MSAVIVKTKIFSKFDSSFPQPDTEYKTDYTTFNICGHDIYVYDDELAKVIKQLSDRYRENVLMYYFLDMSDTEIAKLQNISRSGVFQNRHYALKQMKKSLEEEH